MAENRRTDDGSARPGWDDSPLSEGEDFHPGYTVRPNPLDAQGAYVQVIPEIPSFESLGPRIMLSRDAAGPSVQRVPQQSPPRIAPPRPQNPLPLPVVPRESASESVEGRIQPIPDPDRYYAYVGPNVPRRRILGPRVYLSGEHESPPQQPLVSVVRDSSTQTPAPSIQDAYTQVPVQTAAVESSEPMTDVAAVVDSRAPMLEASTENPHTQ